jgi:hypothetical protein
MMMMFAQTGMTAIHAPSFHSNPFRASGQPIIHIERQRSYAIEAENTEASNPNVKPLVAINQWLRQVGSIRLI